MTHLQRACAVVSVLFSSLLANAGVFTYPHFVNPGEFALGLEPELTFTHGAGIAINARYTQGINDLTDLVAMIGTGSGPRLFRVGAGMIFDFFPDIDKQPGIGLALQGLYVRMPTPGRLEESVDTSGKVEMTAIPFVHKTFASPGGDVDPFIAVPFGMDFSDGQYRALSTVVIGASFKTSPKIITTVEFGIAVNHTESYLSGGISYFH